LNQKTTNNSPTCSTKTSNIEKKSSLKHKQQLLEKDVSSSILKLERTEEFDKQIEKQTTPATSKTTTTMFVF
jgi:hypothetical protein